jgi:formylglycine-generating enzyme required for sulfatase activity
MDKEDPGLPGASGRMCPGCGEKNPGSGTLCARCGARLDEEERGTLPPETKVERYELKRLLGTGGMGEVHLAEHAYTGLRVAIKALWPNLMVEQRSRRRFLEEGRTLAHLRHPGIVRLIDFFEEKGRFYLVTDYVEGEPLDKLLERHAAQGTCMDAKQVASIIRDLLLALAHAHGATPSVVHRDIKPSNVMITPAGRAVLMDFGIARAAGMEKLTRTRGVVGTFEYMSPEQVSGGEATPASDVYSVGVMAYEMLAGTVPFPQTTETGIEAMDGHRFREPPPIKDQRPDCPDWLADIVHAALAKGTDDRFADAADMLLTIRQALGEPVDQEQGASGQTGETVACRPVRRRKRLRRGAKLAIAASAVATLMVLLAGSAVLAVYLTEEDWGVHRLLHFDGNLLRTMACMDQTCGAAGVWDCGRCTEGMTCDEGHCYASEPHGTVVCSPSGVCECFPTCEGRMCGGDGCGGSCGECPGSQDECLDGQCVCVPRCSGRECGSNGCGGTCGSCDTGRPECRDGKCVCEPSCQGKQCGSDGCGGVCGECPPGEFCRDGGCRCFPQCKDRRCGPDGCGGICGECAAGEECVDGGCRRVPQCAGKSCGPDGCGGTCGECRANEECKDGVCSCTSQCEGKQCGPDGCGGSCGECGLGLKCTDGQCGATPLGVLTSPIAGRFVVIPGGSFFMGSPEGEKGRKQEESQHEAGLTRSFLLKETEVTRGEFRKLIGREPPSPARACGDNCPVEMLNWFEAAYYCNRLSREERLDECYELTDCVGRVGSGCGAEDSCTGTYTCGNVLLKSLDCTGYRLPTEAEWEYAARAGTMTPYSSGACLDKSQGNYDGNSPLEGCPKGTPWRAPIAVGGLAANGWGLKDMHGNVAEWVWDLSSAYPGTAVSDPTGNYGTERVVRGGSWQSSGAGCRSAARSKEAPAWRSCRIGLRPARTLR